jgi:hypothetical protein
VAQGEVETVKKCWVVTNDGDEVVAVYSDKTKADVHAAPKVERCWACTGTGRLEKEVTPAGTAFVTCPPGVVIAGFENGVNTKDIVKRRRKCDSCDGRGWYEVSEFTVTEHDIA